MVLKGAGSLVSRCPCCFERGTHGCGSADCAPFAFSSGGVYPALDGTYTTCRSYASSLPAWAQPTYTPKGKDGTQYIYTTLPLATGFGCTYVFMQYCRNNALGTNGSSWVVEYFCRDDSSGAVKHLIDEITNWSCLCDGARYSYDLIGTGTGTGTSDPFGCCGTPGGGTIATTCCPDDLLPASITVSFGACLNLDVPISYQGLLGGFYTWNGAAALTSTRCIDFALFCNSFTLEWSATTGCHSTTGGVCAFSSSSTILVSTLSVSCNPFSGSGTFAAKFASLGTSCCDPASNVTIPFSMLTA